MSVTVAFSSTISKNCYIFLFNIIPTSLYPGNNENKEKIKKRLE